MISRLVALVKGGRRYLGSPSGKVLVATLCLKLGMDALLGVVDDMREQLAVLSAQISEQREVAPESGVDKPAYPSDEDLDPLERHETPAPAVVG